MATLSTLRAAACVMLLVIAALASVQLGLWRLTTAIMVDSAGPCCDVVDAAPASLLAAVAIGNSSAANSTGGLGDRDGRTAVLNDTALDWETKTRILRSTVNCWAHRGRWTFDGDYRFRGQGREHLRGRGNACHGRGTRTHPTPANRTLELNYRWIPPVSCSRRGDYLRDDRLVQALLQRVGCLRLLGVGDSLNDYLITQSLVEYVRQYATWSSRLQHEWIRNDLLLLSKEIVNRADSRSWCWPWAHQLESTQYDVLYLNRGAHRVPTDQFLAEYNETLHYIRHRNPHALVFVRTTPRGHPNCTQYINAPPLTKPFDISTFSAKQREYWAPFGVQNRLLRKLIEDTPSLASHVFVHDVDPATRLRPDSHRTERGDCLHYCILGPTDQWLELYGNALLLSMDLGMLRSCDASNASTASPSPFLRPSAPPASRSASPTPRRPETKSTTPPPP